MMNPFRRVVSRIVVLDRDDVDTDQIIPARFLKGTSREGLGHALFADWRIDAVGTPRAEFVLNRPEAAGARILVAGRNFGCGSSREHAVWALQGFGFQVVLARSLADIFAANALKNGLLATALDGEAIGRVVQETGDLTVDLEAQEVSWGDGERTAFRIPPFARHCLLTGRDELEFLLAQGERIAAFEGAVAKKTQGAVSWC
jgi:3-isopropylmalate/(R)-2-methylmalate dehydratase small subunit